MSFPLHLPAKAWVAYENHLTDIAMGMGRLNKEGWDMTSALI